MAIESKMIKVDIFVDECSIRNTEISVPFDFEELSAAERREIVLASIVDKIPVKYRVKK